jgi:hypothetical protein
MSQQQKPKTSTLADRSEIVLLVLTLAVSSIVSLLDLFGFLDSVPWLKDNVPTITLLMIGLIAGYLVLERRTQIEGIQQGTQQGFSNLEQSLKTSTSTIIESLQGVEIRRFESGNEFMRYINKRLNQVKKQVDDLSCSPAVSIARELRTTLEVDKEYEERVSQVAQQKPYREVFVFNRPGRIEKLRRRLSENQPGYSCAYYGNLTVPVVQFMIIDKEEVLILSDEYESKLAIRHPALVGLFVEYYEEIWRKSTAIKTGTTIDHEVVKRIEGADHIRLSDGATDVPGSAS